jgi:tetratricopeptide (TPR) repeat protein
MWLDTIGHKFDEAIRLDPNYAKAWYNKGEALRKKGKYDDSRQGF